MIAAAVVASVLARADVLIQKQKGLDARDIAALDRKAEGLYSEIKPLGWKAVAPLAAEAKNRKHPLKSRLLATSFIGLANDPAALAPLEDLLLDPEQEPALRSLAAESIPGQKASDAAVASSLCSALEQKDLPEDVVRIVLLPLPRLGCPDAAALMRLARSAGPRPESLAIVAPAIRTLAKSRGTESARALLSLVSYFPPRGEARAEAIKALDARRADVTTWLEPEARPVVLEALRSESERWDTMLALIRIARLFGPDVAGSFVRLSRHPDPEVLAAAAEVMVEFKSVEAIPALEEVVKGAMSDPRFSPKDGRPDPAAMLARVEKALDALRRAR